jgi:uncharacterized membrane protein YedE/YeeE
METEFTPLASLGGGVLIGLSATLLMWGLGRVMGATGVLAGFVQPSSFKDWSWRAMVVAGMVSGPVVIWAVTGNWPQIQVPVPTWMLVLGGFVVGVGVTFGGGCTSGHGVCGIARLSPRSIVATGVFMAATFATVFVIRHVIGG